MKNFKYNLKIIFNLMNKWLFRFFILIQVFQSMKCDIRTLSFDPSMKMILFKDTCIYVTENSNAIYKIKINDNSPTNFTTITNIKNKTLIQLDDKEEFIIFGYNSNQLLYYKFNINNPPSSGQSYNTINIKIENSIGNYTIKHINENRFLLFYVSSEEFFIYSFYLNNSTIQSQKNLKFEKENEFNLNTMDCDSFDGEHIFCVYSMIKKKEYGNTKVFYETIAYYSFENITTDKLGNHELIRNIAGPSLLKLKNNNQQKFLICYYDSIVYVDVQKNHQIYCQYFTVDGNEILREQIYNIATISSSYSLIFYFNFIFQKVVQIIKYKYDLYILVKVKNGNNMASLLYVSSLDLKLIIPYYLGNSLSETKDIFVSSQYILFLIENTNIKIDYSKFEIQCLQNTLFDLTINETLNLSMIAENVKNSTIDFIYTSFDLEPLTNIIINKYRNMGGLLNNYFIKNYNYIYSNISLVRNNDLKITYNYYIYLSDDNSGTDSGYTTYSNFCLLKVLNCYKSCLTCDENIIGTEELNQCKSCKSGYNIFNFEIEGKNFNCYNSSDTKIQNYYFLDPNDKKYYRCDESCMSCKNYTTCTECNTGYYKKEDKDKDTDLCYKETPEGYYIYNNGFITNYQKCYDTCKKCYGKGNEAFNNCIECKEGLVNYPYDNTRCTKNITTCEKYWKINKNNNIECIDECEDYIIHEGDNKNQCVQNCQSYINPFGSGKNQPLLFYSCGNNPKYCITYNYCKLKRLENNLTTCIQGDECFNMSDFTPVTEAPAIPTTIPKPIITTIIITEEPKKEKPEPITERATVVKYFEYINTSYSQIAGNFSSIQISRYFMELHLEKESHSDVYLEGFDFITVNKYYDFIITLYPLDKEDYLYKNVLKTNNLCFINFTEFFNEISYTKHKDDNTILIGLIEFHNDNIPINSINYLFYEYDEKSNDKNKPEEIPKSNLIQNSTFNLNVEYPLYNYYNPNISEQYSSNLIETIKNLNLLNQDIDFFNEDNKVYTDICTPFTSEEGTDMTIADRNEKYLIKISLCENGCKRKSLIDKGPYENPRSVCECQYKENILKSNDNYTFIFEKVEGKNISNFNALKCANTVFSSKEIKNNLIFWIFLLLLIILFITLLVIIFCSKSSVENILKIKKENESEENEANNSGNNTDKNSEKISSVISDENLNAKDKKDSSKNKEIITSKISDASAPPKKKLKEMFSTKGENNMDEKTDNNSFTKPITYFNKFKINYKDDGDDLDEIFPDYNEVLTNNYYQNKFLKNNYINLRLKNLKLKKYFAEHLKQEDYPKHNNTDTEDNLEDSNEIKKIIKRKTIIHRYQTLLPKADIARNKLKSHYKDPQFETEYDEKTKKNEKKKSVIFFEESNIIGDEQIIQNDEQNIKNSNELSEAEDNKNIYIHKKKKSILSSSLSNEKKSIMNSGDSISKFNSLDKYFINSSNINNDVKMKYSFCKFYWIYLNKREFCLLSIYNLDDNIASYIRISTFIFVLSLLFVINSLFLTSNQIHERYIYIKEKGSKNEFSYIFQKEIGIVFLLILIYIIIKMLFIKLIYGLLFKISYAAKEDLSPFYLESQKDNKSIKRMVYLKKYRKKALIYIAIILALMILLGYISICYFGIFKNTKAAIIIRFFIAFIFSIIICAILCLIVVIIFHFSRKSNNKCLQITYRIAKIIY